MEEKQYEQHTIEYFFKKYDITDADSKARLLPLVTDVIYEYNMSVVKLEKEDTAEKKKQIVEDIEEILQKIEKIMTS